MLQGSLDNFALDEVLGLLSSTSKTGKLDVQGDRGTGSLVMNQGQLVDAVASNTANGTALDDVLFELLRFGDGTFSFTATETEVGDATRNIDEVLAAAEGRLADWRTIESVVPSLSHSVTPKLDLPVEEVTIDRQEWAVLMVIAGGCPVSQVCDELGLGEVEGSRQIKGLAERKLVVVGSPQLGGGAPPPERGGAESPAPARPKDPFARRALQAARSADKQLPPPPSPPAGPILSDAPSERVPATAGAGAPSAAGGPGGIDRRAPRPPMPAPPSADELADAGRSAGDGPAEALPADDVDDEAEKPEAHKAGGLLMRYLKSDN
jgi:hypothetical protein